MIFKYQRYKTSRVALLLITITLVSSFPACKKLVEVQSPVNEIVTKDVFSNTATATAALTAIYAQMVDNADAYSIALYTGLSGDELRNYSTSNLLIPFYSNSLVATNGSVQALWTSFYSYIYQANAIIEGVQLSTSLNSKVSRQLKGEAKFIRAFSNFYLVNLFGDIPLVTTTDYRTNVSMPRSPKQLVYKQIIDDLSEAQSLLNNFYVSTNDTTSTTERVRPNKWAATALLARAELYIGDWQNAENNASSLINNISDYKLLDNLDDVFTKNNQEAIWQMPPVKEGYNTIEGANFILTDVPSSGTTNCTTLSDQLINAFENGDLRKNKWISSVNVSMQDYYFPSKYKIQNGSPVIEYSTILRLAEIYLIRAEARVQLNKIAEGQSDLNIIRSRAGLTSITSGDKSALLSAILKERRTELFTEWGHRWMDLKRTGSIDSIMSAVTPLKLGTWNSNWALYPIPQVDRVNNHNLSQNPGY